MPGRHGGSITAGGTARPPWGAPPPQAGKRGHSAAMGSGPAVGGQYPTAMMHHATTSGGFPTAMGESTAATGAPSPWATVPSPVAPWAPLRGSEGGAWIPPLPVGAAAVSAAVLYTNPARWRASLRRRGGIHPHAGVLKEGEGAHVIFFHYYYSRVFPLPSSSSASNACFPNIFAQHPHPAAFVCGDPVDRFNRSDHLFELDTGEPLIGRSGTCLDRLELRSECNQRNE